MRTSCAPLKKAMNELAAFLRSSRNCVGVCRVGVSGMLRCEHSVPGALSWQISDNF